MKSTFTPKRLLFAAVAIFLVNAVTFHRGTQNLSENFGWVVHTLQVQSAIHQVRGDVVMFNRSVRNHRMAPDHPPIEPSLAENLMRDADQIQRLTMDNRSQQRHVGELRMLLAAQMTPRARTTAQPAEAVFANEIDANTRHIMLLLGVMYAEEAELLTQREHETAATEVRIDGLLVFETAAQILGVVLFFSYYSRSRGRKDAMERANVETQANLTSVLECTSDCVMTVGHDWTILYGNRKTREGLPDFKLGADYWTCFPALVGVPVEYPMRTAMARREPVKFENFYAPYASWYKVQIFPTDAGLNIFFSDITEEKKRQVHLEEEQFQRERRIVELGLLTAELAQVNELLTSVMDSSSDGIIKLDPSWQILYGNRVAKASLLDFRINVNFWKCFPALLSTHAEERLITAMRDRVETHYEVFYAPYSGWYKVHVFPTGLGVSLFFSNTTAEKKLQEQLEHEQMLREKRIEALSHMAGGLAHEISNPLAIIHGRATELLDMAAGDLPLAAHEVRAVCDEIVKTSNRASSILRGLRGFAREAGKDPMELASIYNISEESVELQQSRFDRHDVRIQLRIEPNLPLLLCRETQIGQILTNLLNNAFDAIVQAESGARWVQMTVASHAGNIVIEVTDSGPGIEDHFKAHLMEAFFTTKEFGLGMGVGLSLSRAIAQDHGGTLMLCPDRKNTCFQLILPITPNAAEPDVEPTLVGVTH